VPLSGRAPRIGHDREYPPAIYMRVERVRVGGLGHGEAREADGKSAI